MKWIYCKQRLPEKDGLYLIVHNSPGSYGRHEMYFKTEDKKWYWQPNPYSVCGDGFITQWLDETPLREAAQGNDGVEESAWSAEKPKPDKEFWFVSASYFKDHWECRIWQVVKINGPDGWYYGLCDGEGEEWGDWEDLQAERYYILPATK
jgi:hypothetical protein